MQLFGLAREILNVVQKKLRGRPPKDPARRSADRQAMIDAGLEIVRQGGAGTLTARHVAERAGTAVGSVYTQFDSLEALRLEVNALTMRLLRSHLTHALERCQQSKPVERLLCLAHAYLQFAAENHNLWAALFERRTIEAPPAIAADISALFAILEEVLRDIGGPEDEVPVTARALWASVHGMVYLGEIGALGPIRPEDIPPMIDALVSAAVRGFETGRS